jgi:hypothetical protein
MKIFWFDCLEYILPLILMGQHQFQANKTLVQLPFATSNKNIAGLNNLIGYNLKAPKFVDFRFEQINQTNRGTLQRNTP